jgi:hypothetical protein
VKWETFIHKFDETAEKIVETEVDYFLLLPVPAFDKTNERAKN